MLDAGGGRVEYIGQKQGRFRQIRGDWRSAAGAYRELKKVGRFLLTKSIRKCLG
jgi:hypothetical protein